jgi:hypothetical protein
MKEIINLPFQMEITKNAAGTFQTSSYGARGKQMTLRQIAKATGAAYRTVAAYAQKAGWTENGKQTVLDEKQATVIIEAMKQTHSGGPGNVAGALRTSLQGVETTQSRALRIAVLARKQRELDELIKAELEAEVAELKASKEALQIRLSEAEQWYSVKRVLIETGREYPWKSLKEYSLQHGYAVEKAFDKNYGEVNAYHADVWNAVYGVEL